MASTPGQRAAAVAAGVAGAGAGYLATQAFLNSGSNSTTSGGLLKFPLDLTGHNIGFQFFDHKFLTATTNAGSFQKPTLFNSGGIYLPIPNNLKDNTSVEFQNQDLVNPGAIAAAITNTVSGIANALASAAITAAQAATGTALNPFTVVLFKHPNFRTHTFSWKLIPKDASESERIRQIVNELKKNMLPSLGGEGIGTAFFNYPKIVMPKLNPSDEFLYKFKYCFIKDVNVNYAAGGVPAFYKKTRAAPVAVELSITLNEIEWQTAEDFTQQSFGLPSGGGTGLLGPTGL